MSTLAGQGIPYGNELHNYPVLRGQIVAITNLHLLRGRLSSGREASHKLMISVYGTCNVEKDQWNIFTYLVLLRLERAACGWRTITQGGSQTIIRVIDV